MFAARVNLPFTARSKLRDLVERLDECPVPEGEAYVNNPSLVARLPGALLEALIEFREHQTMDAIHIRDIPIGAMADIPTPTETVAASRMLYGFQRIALAILGTLGSAFAYSSQQNGRLLNNIAPMPSDQLTPNIGIGSNFAFQLHSEDAFMTHPPSYLQLACVRNTSRTPTTIAGLKLDDLGDWLNELRIPNFIVSTNPAQHSWGDRRLQPGPVVWGSKARPFLRYNSVNTVVAKENGQSTAALCRFREVLNQNLEDVYVESGDILILNNYRLCHARRAFQARFDGRDRWLIRIVAYRDPAVVARLTGYFPYPTLIPDSEP